MQWIENPSQSNVDNLNKVRRNVVGFHPAVYALIISIKYHQTQHVLY
jgi:hypothetical protein